MQQIASETIQQQEHEANAGDHLVGGNDNDELRVSIQGDDSLIDPQVTASEQHDHQKQQQHQQHQQQQQQGQDQNGILVGNAASGSGHLDGAAPTTATVTKVPGRPGPKPGKKRKAANANISTEFDPDYQQDLTTTGDQQQGARQQSEEADKAVKQTKRAAQNRSVFSSPIVPFDDKKLTNDFSAAQKAFRERRELYIKCVPSTDSHSLTSNALLKGARAEGGRV